MLRVAMKFTRVFDADFDLMKYAKRGVATQFFHNRASSFSASSNPYAPQKQR
jgi:hypothetical protein